MFESLPNELIIYIIQCQIKYFQDYNPSLFSKRYRKLYLQYLKNNTNWN